MQERCDGQAEAGEDAAVQHALRVGQLRTVVVVFQAERFQAGFRHNRSAHQQTREHQNAARQAYKDSGQCRPPIGKGFHGSRIENTDITVGVSIVNLNGRQRTCSGSFSRISGCAVAAWVPVTLCATRTVGRRGGHKGVTH